MRTSRVLTLAAVLCGVSAFASELNWDQYAGQSIAQALTLDGDTTIVVGAGHVVTNTGVISGTGKLVKSGGGRLVLKAANTYTGGTLISEGKLEALHAFALGATSGEVEIAGDCSTLAAANSTALWVNAATFAYPIKVAAWSGELPKEGGSAWLVTYNVMIMQQCTLSGKITGGSLSLRYAPHDNDGEFKSLSGQPTFTGEIDCSEGTVFGLSRTQSFKFNGVVKAKRVTTARKRPTAIQLGNADNQIELLDVSGANTSLSNQGVGVTATGANAFGGAVVTSSATGVGSTSSDGTLHKLSLGGYDQTIDRFERYAGSQQWKKWDETSHIVAAGSTTKETHLTMNATADSECDWLFTGFLSLNWNPSDDYSMSCISNRASSMTGSITVSKGTFEVTKGCSFANISGLFVRSGANFVMSTDAIRNDGTLEIEVASDGEIKIPDGLQLDIYSLKVGDRYVTVGSHSDVPQIKGGSVYVHVNPGAVEKTYTWTGTAASPLFSAKDPSNWDETPEFSGGGATLRFATGGVRAESDVEVALVKGILFDGAEGVSDFTLAGEEPIAVQDGGLVATNASVSSRYAVEAPLCVAQGQVWDVGENVSLSVTAPLLDSNGTGYPVTVRGRNDARFWISGNEKSTYSGDFRIAVDLFGTAKTCQSPGFYATGTDPFGPAGSGAKLYVTGKPAGSDGNHLALYATNAVVNRAIVCDSYYGFSIYSCAGSTNVFNGPITHPLYLYIGEKSRIEFNGAFNVTAAAGNQSTFLLYKDTDRSQADSEIVFNGPINYSGAMTVQNAIDNVWLACPSNALGEFACDNKVTVNFGADYALSDGRTKLSLAANSISAADLHGHDQHIGRLGTGCSHTGTSIKSTGRPATLRINQTEDVAFRGRIYDAVTIVKEGEAVLAFTNGVHESTGALVVEAGTLEFRAGSSWRKGTNVTVRGTGTLKLGTANDLSQAAVLTLGGTGAVALPEGQTKLFKLYYEQDGETVPAPKGVYGPNSVPEGLPEGFAAHFAGAGTLRVSKSDLKTGVLLIVR